MKYNGWTNYATWRVALEIFDGLNGDHMDAEWCKAYAETIIFSDTSNGLARDYALAFLSDVNWHEIASKTQEDE